MLPSRVGRTSGLLLRAPCRLVPERRRGPFRLLAHVGDGRRGAAWLARFDGDERPWLVREPSSAEAAVSLAEDVERSAPFAEGWTLERYDAEGGPVFAGRPVIGETLATVLDAEIESGSPLPLDAAFAIVAGICARLGEGGHVHGDLAPHHVLLGYDGEVHIVDAAGPREGLARAGLPGRSGYRSPEHVERRPLVPASDVFVAGILLFELTTGLRLYGSDDGPPEAAILAGRHPRPRTVVGDGYPIDLQVLLRKMVRGPAEARYETPAQARDALRLVAGTRLGRPAALSRYMHARFAERHAAWRDAFRALSSEPVHASYAHEEEGNTVGEPHGAPPRQRGATAVMSEARFDAETLEEEPGPVERPGTVPTARTGTAAVGFHTVMDDDAEALDLETLGGAVPSDLLSRAEPTRRADAAELAPMLAGLRGPVPEVQLSRPASRAVLGERYAQALQASSPSAARADTEGRVSPPRPQLIPPDEGPDGFSTFELAADLAADLDLDGPGETVRASALGSGPVPVVDAFEPPTGVMDPPAWSADARLRASTELAPRGAGRPEPGTDPAASPGRRPEDTDRGPASAPVERTRVDATLLPRESPIGTGVDLLAGFGDGDDALAEALDELDELDEALLEEPDGPTEASLGGPGAPHDDLTLDPPLAPAVGVSSGEEVIALDDAMAGGEFLTVDEDESAFELPSPRKIQSRGESIQSRVPDLLREMTLDSQVEGTVPPLSREALDRPPSPTPLPAEMPIKRVDMRGRRVEPAIAAPRLEPDNPAPAIADTLPRAPVAPLPDDLPAPSRPSERRPAPVPAKALPPPDLDLELPLEARGPREDTKPQPPNPTPPESAAGPIPEAVISESDDSAGELVVPVSDADYQRDRRARRAIVAATTVGALALAVVLAVVGTQILGPTPQPEAAGRTPRPAVPATAVEPADPPVEPTDPPVEPTDPPVEPTEEPPPGDPAEAPDAPGVPAPATAVEAPTEPEPPAPPPVAAPAPKPQPPPAPQPPPNTPAALAAPKPAPRPAPKPPPARPAAPPKPAPRPAPKPPPARPAAPPKPAPVPAVTTVRINVFPRNATIEIDGVRVENGAAVEIRDRPRTVVARAPGYVELRETLRPGRTTGLDVILSREPSP